ncbi:MULTISPECIES: chloride channel protein [unclassified Adlercreutzia]|uniref:chloride channel protein n=1 Tax=unclassified Adlercreutzia TaxID=2636013 RepID=UPI0013EA3873|nr:MULTISPECIES: chloride channel protein [unclassified Adlercreutzia]
MIGKAVRWTIFVVCAVALGAAAGAFAWAFFFLMNSGIGFLWGTVPEALGSPIWYPVVVCAAGGLAVGLFTKRFGDYPEGLNEVLGKVKRDSRYEYNHMGASFFGALLPLLFGGSIGPEAGLTGVIAGLCTWVGDRLRFLGAEFRELSSVGVSAVVSAIFAAPLFGLAVPLVGSADGARDARGGMQLNVPRATKTAVYLCAVAGALGMMMLLGDLFGMGGGLPHFSGIEVGAYELAWGVPLALAGAAAGALYLASGVLVGAVARAMGDRPVVKALVAGVILGCAGVVLPFAMFAGEEQAIELEGMWTALGAGVLIVTCLVKVVVTQVCLGLGWRGGHFFPIIFAGISLGYGFAALTGADAVFCLCACTAGLLGCVMRQPIMVALLLFLCFPVKGVLVMLAAAAIGAAVPVPRSWLGEQGAKGKGAEGAQGAEGADAQAEGAEGADARAEARG